jgi:hypothetical protein
MTGRSWLSVMNHIFFAEGYRANVRQSGDEPVRTEHLQQIVKYF